MDIYHTKKQTENIPLSCSYLLLKRLFYFISQCISEPYLECCLCKLDKKLDNCNFTIISSRNRPFNESNYEVCKYKTLRYTELFSLHNEHPRMKGRNITEQRCDKRKNFSSAKENSKTRK